MLLTQEAHYVDYPLIPASIPPKIMSVPHTYFDYWPATFITHFAIICRQGTPTPMGYFSRSFFKSGPFHKLEVLGPPHEGCWCGQGRNCPPFHIFTQYFPLSYHSYFLLMEFGEDSHRFVLHQCASLLCETLFIVIFLFLIHINRRLICKVSYPHLSL